MHRARQSSWPEGKIFALAVSVTIRQNPYGNTREGRSSVSDDSKRSSVLRWQGAQRGDAWAAPRTCGARARPYQFFRLLRTSDFAI